MIFFKFLHTVNNTPRSTLVIFSGQLEVNSVDYSSKIEEEFRQFPDTPDEVVFIYPAYINPFIKTYFLRGTRCYECITRFPGVPVTLLPFNERGQLSQTSLTKKTPVKWNSNELRDLIIESGIHHLMKKRKNNVILRSPPGTTFSKPSEREKREFIKASELAIGYSECQFVAFSLLTKAPNPKKIKSIFIDSSSIAIFVEPILFYWSKFLNYDCKTARYLSFGSYRGLKDSKPDVTGDIWVIISASSSNELGRKIAKDWRLSNKQIVTILSYQAPNPETDGTDIVANISSFSEEADNEIKFGSTLPVKMIGENFTAEVESPNSVLINITHKTQEITSWISKNYRRPLIHCNVALPEKQETCAIYVNPEGYFNDDSLKEWIARIANWSIPAHTKWLIFDPNDKNSQILKEAIQKSLHSAGVRSIEDVDINNQMSRISGDDPAIIICPVCRTGTTLLKANSELRLLNHQGNRIFIVPFVLSPSRAHFEQLRKSCQYGPKGFNYSFFSFHHSFIGHEDRRNSWEEELLVVESLDSRFWKERYDILKAQTEGIKGKIGISPLGGKKNLEFTKDFAFWGNEYDPDEVYHEFVYLTISSILQGLREKPYTHSNKSSLQPHVYQHSVISPENFTRYNDSLLQSCLWRAAYFRELDYRNMIEESNRLASILISLIEAELKGKNSAALDLLMGIAIGKIALSKDAVEEIVERAKTRYIGKKHAIELIDYIRENILKESFSKTLPI